MLPSEESEAVREKVVQLGYLDASAANEALQRYASLGGANFGSFLLEEGLLDLEQLNALQSGSFGDTITGSATAAYEPKSRIGEIVSGCRITSKLGQGGMGSVFAATRVEDKQRVVVKFLDPTYAIRKTSRARFLRTAQLVQGFAHPNVAAIHSVHDADPEPYCIMELVAGEPLQDVFEARGPLPWKEALQYARGIALGLGAAHKNGILHRDVKPENVLITPDGDAKLIDFGLAKNTLADEGLSHAGQVLGTPYYMAPEQWGEHEVDARCDIFSLGATLYHIVTGKLPFNDETAIKIAQKIVKGVYRAPRQVLKSLPVAVELVLFRMLESDRRFRYSTVDDCVSDIDRVLAGDWPDVARLEPADPQVPVETYPLLPGRRFTIGRRTQDDGLHLRHPTVSREHAEVRREATGYVLRDMGSSFGTFVGEQRVREVVLKDGDPLRFGKLPFVFRAGLLPPDPPPPERETAQAGMPFLNTLVAEGDKRAVLNQIEDLAPGTHEARVDMARKQVAAALGERVADRVARVLDKALNTQTRRTPARLFAITREKLGDDPGRWLTWWGQTWSSLPPQFGPVLPAMLPKPFLRVVKGMNLSRFDLSEGATFSIGREEGKAISLADPSVSRLHATIRRLDQRLAIFDESSRFGTVVNGKRVSIAFLSPGDRLRLGAVDLEFDEEKLPPPPVGPLFRVEPEAFEALVEIEPRATVFGLIRFLSRDPEEWMAEEAVRLAPNDAGLQDRLLSSVHRQLEDWRERSRQVLPQVLGVDLEGHDRYLAAFTEFRAKLPPQAHPVGWGLEPRRHRAKPAPRGSGSRTKISKTKIKLRRPTQRPDYAQRPEPE